MVIFICAYAGIYQGRVSPIAIVSCGSLATVVGWILWDYWMGLAEDEHEPELVTAEGSTFPDNIDDGSSTSSVGSSNAVAMHGHISRKHASTNGLGLTLTTSNLGDSNEGRKTPSHSASLSRSSAQSISPIESLHPSSGSEPFPDLHPTVSRLSRVYYPPTKFSPSLSPRVQARLKTFKSAILIYFALLGLSPILKSLTKSTSSDSIWALATWLLIINIFFFDYGGLYIPSKSRPPTTAPNDANVPPNSTFAPVHDVVRAPPFPSSLSTNAALMASTVLASRLTSTTHVFSLTLFSIEVFGLFPVFRRHLRHESWTGHVLLTTALVALSSGGMGLILAKSYTHTYGACGFCWGWIWHVVSRSLLGLIIGGLGTAFVMGGCSWWLIGLQRYKNVVTGPWDPARPILAGGTHRGRGATE